MKIKMNAVSSTKTISAILFAAFVSATSIGATDATTEDYRKYYSIESVETQEIETDPDALEAILNRRGFDAAYGRYSTLGEFEGELDTVIRIGEKVWKIIDRNKPVVNHEFKSASLLPEGARSARDLEGWGIPQTRTFETSYKNGFGMKVVSFKHRVHFTPKGNVAGKGQYLSTIGIENADLSVAWGFTFNASAEVVNEMNAGSKAEPVAAAELRLNWSVKTVMKSIETSTRYYVRGDGLFMNLSNGSMR